MLRVYEESVVQTEVLSSLQKAMETEEHLTIQKQLPRKSQLKPTGNSTYLSAGLEIGHFEKKLKTQEKKTSITQGKNSRSRLFFAK